MLKHAIQISALACAFVIAQVGNRFLGSIGGKTAAPTLDGKTAAMSKDAARS